MDRLHAGGSPDRSFFDAVCANLSLIFEQYRAIAMPGMPETLPNARTYRSAVMHQRGQIFATPSTSTSTSTSANAACAETAGRPIRRFQRIADALAASLSRATGIVSACDADRSRQARFRFLRATIIAPAPRAPVGTHAAACAPRWHTPRMAGWDGRRVRQPTRNTRPSRPRSNSTIPSRPRSGQAYRCCSIAAAPVTPAPADSHCGCGSACGCG